MTKNFTVLAIATSTTYTAWSQHTTFTAAAKAARKAGHSTILDTSVADGPKAEDVALFSGGTLRGEVVDLNRE